MRFPFRLFGEREQVARAKDKQRHVEGVNESSDINYTLGHLGDEWIGMSKHHQNAAHYLCQCNKLQIFHP
jgi:hypothetical protein